MQLPNKYSDEFMDLLHQEDRRVWEFVYNDMIKVLLPIGFRYTRDVEEGRSLMHDCWIKVINVIREHRFGSYEAFRKFCNRVMVNLSSNYKRDGKLRAQRNEYLELFVFEVLLFPDETDRRELIKIFHSFPEKDRKVLRLHYMENVDIGRIPNLLNMSRRKVFRIHASFLKDVKAMKQVV